VLPLFLAASAFGELRDGLGNVRQANGSSVLFESILQLASGVFSVAAVVAIWVRRELVFSLLVAWGVTITAVASLAPVVFGGESAGVGAAAGLSTAVVVGFLIWAWQRQAAPTRKT
jgi:hypothetical protein